MSHEETQDLNELKKVRIDKLNELKAMGIDPFGQRFERSATAEDIHQQYQSYEGQTVKMAGRIMSKRRHGKAGFANLQDYSGEIQLYFRKDDLGEENYEFIFRVFIRFNNWLSSLILCRKSGMD